MEDTDLMPFGQYKKTKTQMANVPAEYLLWLHEEGSAGVRRTFPQVFEYIKDNLDLIKEGQ